MNYYELLEQMRCGSRATFELRPLFVCSTLTLLTEALHRRELALCAKSGPEQMQQISLFDHLVSSQKHRLSDHEPERFGRGNIDDQLELSWLYHW
jgi:hypothetical protein